METANTVGTDANWNNLYIIGGTTALMILVSGLTEIFLPGDSTPPRTVIDLFVLIQKDWFAGLRDMGLMNIIIIGLGIPTFFALYAAHRKAKSLNAALALIVSLLGATVFMSTNRAFPMLELSRQYAAATTDAQRAMFAAAGQAMLSVGGSHTPGTFIGFFFIQVAGVAISVIMLKEKIFNKVTAISGILGFGLMLIFETCSSFVPVMSGAAILFAIGGGLSMMLWYLLVARRLFQLGQAKL